MDKRMINVWDRYAKFLYRNDPRTIDWTNKEQPKFFPYVDFKSQKIKVGKTTNLMLPTITYASHPRLVRKAIEFVGELALKKYGFMVEMTKKNSGLPIKVNLYDKDNKLISEFKSQTDCAKYIGCSPTRVRAMCDSDTLLDDKFYIRRT